MKHPVNRALAEYQSAGGSQHRTPVRGLRVIVRPNLLPRVHVPRLYFAEVIRARNRKRTASRNAYKRLTRLIFRLQAHVRTAQIVIGGDINHAGFRTKCDGRPGFSAMRSGAKGGPLAGARLMFGIDVRTPGNRVNAFDHVAVNVWLSIDEADVRLAAGQAGSVEKPHVAVPRDVHQPVNGSSITLVIHQYRWRNLV